MSAAAGRPGGLPSYRSQAEALARDLVTAWDPHDEDLGELAKTLHSKLAQEANHELRQVLTHLTAELEMAISNQTSGSVALPEERARQMLAALGRAASVVETFLDPDQSAVLLLQCDMEHLRLDTILSDHLAQLPEAYRGDAAEMHLAEATVEGDRDKLATSLCYLVDRFTWRSGATTAPVVRLEATEERVEGFIGAKGAPVETWDLLEELEEPLDIEAVRVDLPYVRAVIERHGGTLFVSQPEPGLVGIAFALPRHHPGRSSPG